MLRIVFVIPLLSIFLACQHPNTTHQQNTYKNIQWTILAFEDTIRKFQINNWLWLDAEFLTQNDSVFWNSHHEGADKFFIQLGDTFTHPFYYPFYKSSEGDSLVIIAPKDNILQDIFNLSECPAFLKNDSVINCFIKIKKQFLFPDKDMQVFQKDEQQQITDFLQKNKPLYQMDTNGIIWLEPLPIPDFKDRKNTKEATVAYSGYFLDGRMIDHSDSLGIRYNDTLQLIEGLNYVIKKLEVGQSAKIILPSQLAFGKRGSLNKTIPPFTPLLYEIKLMQIK